MVVSSRCLFWLAACLLPCLFLLACTPEDAETPPRGEVSTSSEVQGVPGEPHSLLLVTLDTTRADRLQPYDGRYATPALQQLADDGIVMQQAVAVSPLTLPTHASLLTGLYPPQHGVRSNGRHRLGDGVQTLAEYFDARGDRTAAFLSAAVLERRYGLDQGFQLYDDSLEGGKADESRMISERRAGETVERALAWLDAMPEGERFFLWVHLFDPHASYDPPSPHREAYADEPYQGEIHYMDAQVGRLLDHRRLTNPQSTAVSVIADHGESLGQHGEATHGLLAYDATLRIPWILRLPGGPQGLQWPEPVSQVDMLPTLLEAQGIDFDRSAVSGVSLLPFASPQDGSRTLYAESLDPLFLYGWHPLEVARQGPWKYIDAPTPELYHLLDDPDESENVYSRQRGTARDLALHLASIRDAAPAEGEDPLPLDAETRAKLESLGYTATTATSTAQHGERTDRPDPKEVIDLHHIMQQAEGLMAQGRRQTALEVLETILERDPRNHQALLHVSRLRFEAGDLAAAVRVLEEGLQYYPGETSMSLSLAAMEHQRGRFERAAVLARQALSSDPNQVEPWLRTARYLLDAGQGDALGQLYADATERFPDDAVLHGQMGKVLAEAANPQAEVALRHALEIRPQADLYLALADFLEARGRTDEANQQRQLANAGTSPTGDTNARAEALARQGELQEAEAIWRQLIQDEPEAAAPYGNLATLALQRQDWNQARQLARRAVELDATLAPSWNVLAYALEELGRPADAVNAYQRALEVDPQYTTARFNLGLLFKKQQAFPQAAQVFETLLRTQPDHWNAHFELILLYAGPLGDPARARPHLLRNLEAQPGHPKAPLLRELLGRIDGAMGGG